MEDFQLHIPDDVKRRLRTTPDGNEIVIPYPEVVEAVGIATRHDIAVLGVEMFELQGTADLLAIDYSGYECSFESDWKAFVLANNQEALQFIESHAQKEGQAYILTTTSRREYGRRR